MSTTSKAVAGETPRLPPKVNSVISRRLAGLPQGAREFAEWCAAYGRAFRQISCAESFRARKKMLPQVSMSFGAGALFGNAGQRHSISLIIREVAYAGISPARRLHFHRRLAETLVACGEGARQRRRIISIEREMSRRRSGNIASRAKRRFVCAPIDAPYICSSYGAAVHRAAAQIRRFARGSLWTKRVCRLANGLRWAECPRGVQLLEITLSGGS